MSVIGIAFGNTSSSIAVANQDGKIDVIANPDGDRAIPSVLSYVGEDEYHGAQAKAQLIRNPASTVTNFRDHIGKNFDEIIAAGDETSAKLIATENGAPGYKVQDQILSVEEITKRHLLQLKLAAEDYMGTKVEGVVITVPTDFTAKQKEALTKVAGEANLKVLQLINEPSAALLAHLSTDRELLLQDKIYIVADFGGIRSDAAVIAVRGGIMTILATAHERFGGDQLDAALMEHFAKEFEKKYKADPRKTARSLAKLKAESIVVKKTLSNVQSSTCSIESLAEGFDFHSNINRLRYELAARDPLSKMTAFVESAAKKAGLDVEDINEVLLVGGSAQTPKLASNVQFIFPESTVVVAPSLGKSIDPSELICRGAALQAQLIESFDEEEINESLQPIVINTQHLKKPIGLKDANGEFVPILVAETAYPIKKSIEVSNGEASNVVVELYEGEREIKETVIEQEQASDDSDEEYSDEEPEVRREVVYKPGQLLAEVALKDLKPNSQLEVIVNIIQNGALHVSAREMKPGAVAIKGEIPPQ